MDLDDVAWEVWIESVNGTKSRAVPEHGLPFRRFKDARKFAQTFQNDGMVIRTTIVETKPVETSNCAGAVYGARMGLKNVNVQGGGKIQIGRDPSPFRRPET